MVKPTNQLEHCITCNQITNHKGNICLKHMNLTQQKIKESLWSIGEKISSSYKEKSISGEYYNPRLTLKQFEIIESIVEQSQIELLELLKGEIEKILKTSTYMENQDMKVGAKLVLTEVLDLLTNLEK